MVTATRDDKYVIYEDVPVWREHVNDVEFTEPIKFDRAALRRIVECCNKRIEDSGDYAAIVIGHSDEKDRSEVVGLAGPYKLGTIGSGKNRSTAILARFRIYKADADKVPKNPRRSVEYWTSRQDPTTGFFDPICLLSSETPRLNLGVLYKQHEEYERAGLMCARYQMPDESADRRGNSLSSDELNQIVAAMKPVLETIATDLLPAVTAKWIAENINAASGEMAKTAAVKYSRAAAKTYEGEADERVRYAKQAQEIVFHARRKGFPLKFEAALEYASNATTRVKYAKVFGGKKPSRLDAHTASVDGGERLWEHQELANALGIHRETLKKMTVDKKVPYEMKGARQKYRLATVLEKLGLVPIELVPSS